MKKMMCSALLALSPCWVFAQADTAVQTQIDQLQKQLDELQKQVKSNEKSHQSLSDKWKQQPLLSTGTTFDMGGFVKVDAMWSQYSDRSRHGAVGDDFLVPSVIAVGDGANEGDALFDITAKTSRIYFKSTTPLDNGGKVSSYIELDFQTKGDERIVHRSNTGLRHVFLDYSPNQNSTLRVGQAWSTFFNVGSLPETVDFVGPTSGLIFARQAQVRYTRKLDNGSSWSVAAENPSSGFHDGGSGVNNNNFDDSLIPDVVARYNGKAGDFSYSLAGIYREVRYDTGALVGKEAAPGISFSGKYVLDNGDDFKFMISNGHLGRYIALNAFRDGVVRANGDIDLIDITGGFLAYKHKWTDTVRSTVSYAMATADNPESAITDLTKTVSNLNVNLMYSPSKKTTFGAEYILGERETESGADGDLSRIQFTAKYVF